MNQRIAAAPKRRARGRGPLFSTIAALCALSAIMPATAQDEYLTRQSTLNALATIFGELHHIRGQCRPRREAMVWRDRMQQMIRLEEPSADGRDRLVRAFNRGYTDAQSRFAHCSRAAGDYAAMRAAEGDRIVTALASALDNVSSADIPEAVSVYRGGNRFDR